jgi:hypothetical protein
MHARVSSTVPLIAVLLAFLCGRSVAQEYRKLRYDEDWTYLRDPAKHTDVWDPIKYIPLDATGDSYLSFGGEARLRYELYDNYRWDQDAPDQDGYLLQRYLLSGDLHLGEHFRAFGQLQSSLENWREGGPRGTDEDELDVHQLFADFAPWTGKQSLTLRVGRQEMLYGSQRLVSVRESPNIRRAFDAVRLLTRSGDWRVDAFLSRPVEADPGTFDDWGDGDTTFWGVYATHPLRCLGDANLDLYYLGLDRPEAEFAQGTADELRHSLGARLSGKRRRWDYNFEAVFQFGSFGGGDIVAWTFASDTGYTFDHVAMKPRVGLRADVISGDTNENSSGLGTFNALFPRGAYFSEAGVIGPANLIDVHPTLDLDVTKSLHAYVDWDVLWRYSTHDGIYDNGGNVLRGADGSASFIGQQVGIQLEWEIDHHTTLNAAYSHFFPGTYIKESGPGAAMDFLGVWVIYRF